MASQYVRCDRQGCICDLAGGPDPKDPNDPNKYSAYTAGSSKTKPCEGFDFDCKCFVVAQLIRPTTVVVGQSCITGKPITAPSFEVVEEAVFSGSGKTEGTLKPLDLTEAKALEAKKTPGKDEYWGIIAACLLIWNAEKSLPATTDEVKKFYDSVGKALRLPK